MHTFNGLSIVLMHVVLSLNGIRQGSILSPQLFPVYVDDLSTQLKMPDQDVFLSINVLLVMSKTIKNGIFVKFGI